ncbi:unnamed protein product [Gongylonema pulchrum]|uniref:AKAP7_NLS domain-containing protein n=1 Tax=Gongylonema pulchrum TaxID=637853 RepID=A0A183E0V0_9BILA|nr:unnamed protein product [Gongylonema pulchrum]
METTVTTLKWGFLLSIVHPEVQDKVQQELDQIGTKITLADKANCPFTMATIHVSFSILHQHSSALLQY